MDNLPKVKSRGLKLFRDHALAAKTKKLIAAAIVAAVTAVGFGVSEAKASVPTESAVKQEAARNVILLAPAGATQLAQRGHYSHSSHSSHSSHYSHYSSR